MTDKNASDIFLELINKALSIGLFKNINDVTMVYKAYELLTALVNERPDKRE